MILIVRENGQLIDILGIGNIVDDRQTSEEKTFSLAMAKGNDGLMGLECRS